MVWFLQRECALSQVKRGKTIPETGKNTNKKAAAAATNHSRNCSEMPLSSSFQTISKQVLLLAKLKIGTTYATY